MKSSQIKLALFYVCTIVGVIILFATVTSYGEAHLKAYPSVDGVYKLDPMPQFEVSCLSNGTPEAPSPRVFLALHQSGVFINASLVRIPISPAPQDDAVAKILEQKTTLIGNLKNQSFEMKGTVEDLGTCSEESKAVKWLPAVIRGTLNHGEIKGTLELSSIPGGTQFLGTRLEEPQEHAVSKAGSH